MKYSVASLRICNRGQNYPAGKGLWSDVLHNSIPYKSKKEGNALSCGKHPKTCLAPPVGGRSPSTPFRGRSVPTSKYLKPLCSYFRVYYIMSYFLLEQYRIPMLVSKKKSTPDLCKTARCSALLLLLQASNFLLSPVTTCCSISAFLHYSSLVSVIRV